MAATHASWCTEWLYEARKAARCIYSVFQQQQNHVSLTIRYHTQTDQSRCTLYTELENFYFAWKPAEIGMEGKEDDSPIYTQYFQDICFFDNLKKKPRNTWMLPVFYVDLCNIWLLLEVSGMKYEILQYGQFVQFVSCKLTYCHQICLFVFSPWFCPHSHRHRHVRSEDIL